MEKKAAKNAERIAEIHRKISAIPKLEWIASVSSFIFIQRVLGSLLINFFTPFASIYRCYLWNSFDVVQISKLKDIIKILIEVCSSSFQILPLLEAPDLSFP